MENLQLQAHTSKRNFTSRTFLYCSHLQTQNYFDPFSFPLLAPAPLEPPPLSPPRPYCCNSCHARCKSTGSLRLRRCRGGAPSPPSLYFIYTKRPKPTDKLVATVRSMPYSRASRRGLPLLLMFFVQFRGVRNNSDSAIKI